MKGTLVHCLWDVKLVPLLWKTIWPFLKELKIELPCVIQQSHLGVPPKEGKPVFCRDFGTSSLIELSFAMARTLYVVFKKETLSLTTWTNLEDFVIILSCELSQLQDNYLMV
jgi:hypothetical protein